MVVSGWICVIIFIKEVMNGDFGIVGCVWWGGNYIFYCSICLGVINFRGKCSGDWC